MQYDGHPGGPRIHDSCLPQARQELRRAFDAGIGFANRLVENGGERRSRLVSCFARGCRRIADCGQHRALDGLRDSIVGNSGGCSQRVCQSGTVQGIAAVEPLREAAQDLREDDAAVAAGT